MDAAEQLFAEHGFAQSSDRRVAEAAGAANHSAVSYHFGGRDGLLRAMVDRHLEGLEEPRRRMFAESDSLLGDVRSLVIPFVDAFEQLPRPSWRARFLEAAAGAPEVASIVRSSGERMESAGVIAHSIAARLDDLPAEVVRARVSLMTKMVWVACADFEGRRPQESVGWRPVGEFLCDAVVGMLQGPSRVPL